MPFSCFLFRPRKSREKRRKRSHTNVSMHRSYELQGSLKRRRKHPHPTSINGYHMVKMLLAQSSTNGPRSLSRVKAGTHSAFGEKSHTRAHTAKQVVFWVGGGITTLGAFRTFRKPCVAGCQNGVLCRFWGLVMGAPKERREPSGQRCAYARRCSEASRPRWAA